MMLIALVVTTVVLTVYLASDVEDYGSANQAARVDIRLGSLFTALCYLPLYLMRWRLGPRITNRLKTLIGVALTGLLYVRLYLEPDFVTYVRGMGIWSVTTVTAGALVDVGCVRVFVFNSAAAAIASAVDSVRPSTQQSGIRWDILVWFWFTAYGYYRDVIHRRDFARKCELHLARRTAEEVSRLHRFLTDSTLDVIAVHALSADGTGARFRYVSPACVALTGWTKGELRGRSPLELVHPDDAAVAREVYSVALSLPEEKSLLPSGYSVEAERGAVAGQRAANVTGAAGAGIGAREAVGGAELSTPLLDFDSLMDVEEGGGLALRLVQTGGKGDAAQIGSSTTASLSRGQPAAVSGPAGSQYAVQTRMHEYGVGATGGHAVSALAAADGPGPVQHTSAAPRLTWLSRLSRPQVGESAVSSSPGESCGTTAESWDGTTVSSGEPAAGHGSIGGNADAGHVRIDVHIRKMFGSERSVPVPPALRPAARAVPASETAAAGDFRRGGGADAGAVVEVGRAGCGLPAAATSSSDTGGSTTSIGQRARLARFPGASATADTAEPESGQGAHADRRRPEESVSTLAQLPPQKRRLQGSLAPVAVRAAEGSQSHAPVIVESVEDGVNAVSPVVEPTGQEAALGRWSELLPGQMAATAIATAGQVAPPAQWDGVHPAPDEPRGGFGVRPNSKHLSTAAAGASGAPVMHGSPASTSVAGGVLLVGRGPSVWRLRFRHKRGGYVALEVSRNETSHGLVCVYRAAGLGWLHEAHTGAGGT
jgi:PAS domain S-box-containing protein